MKSFAAFPVVVLMSIFSAAQQPGTDRDRPAYSPDKRCGEFGYLVDHPSLIASCDRYDQNYDRAMKTWYENTKDGANAIKDLRKLQSKDVGEQIDGVTGVAADMNARGNKNEASQHVTDQSVNLLNQMAHQEKAILDNVGNSVEKTSQQESRNTGSSFNSSGHTLNAGTSAEEGQLSLEQQFQNQANQVRNGQGQGTGNWDNQNTSVSSVTLQGAFQNQESNILKSPSAVLALAKADRERQTALEEQRIQLSKAAMEEAREEAKLKAEEEKASDLRRRQIDGELATRRAERRAAWNSARRQWLQAMGVLPPDPPPYTPNFSPSLPGALSVPSLSNSQSGSKNTSSGSDCHPGPGDTVCR